MKELSTWRSRSGAPEKKLCWAYILFWGAAYYARFSKADRRPQPAFPRLERAVENPEATSSLSDLAGRNMIKRVTIYKNNYGQPVEEEPEATGICILCLFLTVTNASARTRVDVSSTHTILYSIYSITMREFMFRLSRVSTKVSTKSKIKSRLRVRPYLKQK